jgi:6-bladed beta-propeller
MDSRGRRRGPVIVSVSLAAMACGAGGSNGGTDDGWLGTVETLDNGAVRVANPSEGLWDTEGGAWRLVPELVLGEIDGPGADVFASISALEVGASGVIYVLDRQMNELRMFSSEGDHLRTVGRTGEGPSEYVKANGLQWLTPDTLVVVDQRGGRYSVLTAEGDYVRSVPRQLGFYAWMYRGGVKDGSIYESSFDYSRDDPAPILLGTALQGIDHADSPDSSDSSDLSDSSGVPAGGDTIALARTAAPAFEGFSVRTERGGMTMGVPFTPNAIYRIDAAGGLWHGHGSALRLFRSTFAGDTLLEIVVDAEPNPVTSAELAEWRAGPGVEQFLSMGGDLDMDRIPETKPFFDDIVVDPDGTVWLSTPAGPTNTEFAVVNADGMYLGRLALDGIRRDVYIAPVVANDRLYLVGKDEFDVQHVYGFRIER